MQTFLCPQIKRFSALILPPLAALVLLLANTGETLAQTTLYSFGAGVGDTALPSIQPLPNTGTTNNTFASTSWLGVGPAGSSLTTPFFGNSFNGLWVDDAGMVTFKAGAGDWTPTPFPVTNPLPGNYNLLTADNPVLAPFWGDVDTDSPASGKVWYRTVQDTPTLTAIAPQITGHFLGATGFTPTFAEVVTWDHVGYASASGTALTDKLNTFQLVLASDGVQSYAVYLYPQGGINWTIAPSAPNNYAVAGFSAGDGTDFYNLPGSGTSSISNLPNASNGFPSQAGLFVMKIDNGGLTSGTWNKSTGNWLASGTNWTGNAAWNNGQSATFSGTAGTVTTTSPITAKTITLNTSGYTFTSGTAANSLQFNKLTLVSGTSAATFGGSLVVVTNAADAITQGNLTFSGSSVLVARTTGAVNGGAIKLQNNAQLQIYSAGATTRAASLTFDKTLGGTGGTLDLLGNNSTLGAISSTGTSSGVITNSGTGAAALTVDFDTAASTFNGRIQNGTGTLSLTKSGSGTFTLSGSNTFTGGTTVQQGTLLVSGSLNGVTGAVNVTGGTLGGSGLIGGLVTVGNGGTITTGSALGTIGKLTLQTGLNASSGGTYLWELGALKDNSTGVAGTDFDRILLTGGNLTLAGTSKLTLDFSLLGGSNPDSSNTFWNSDHSWTIIAGSGGATNPGSTSFFQITDPTFAAGAFSTTADASGNVTLAYLAVPEPSTFVSLGLGAASLLAWRRKRRK